MKKLMCIWLLVMVASLGMAQAPTLEFTEVVTGLISPLDVVSANDGTNRLFVVQRGTPNGIADIRIVQNGVLLPTPFVTVTGIRCCGEQGLLSLVFHPAYQQNGIFFVYYTATDKALTIARYKVSAGNANVADPNSKQVILSIPHANADNHNGGKLIFGPDGFLYVGTGDGGSANDPQQNGQNPGTLLGKLLRIDPIINANTPPFYNIPPSNPYLAPGDGVLDEIYAMGLRNPWRWSFDRQTGHAWIADVGQGAWEEVNDRTGAQLPGTNFGWRCFEGLVAVNQPCALFNGQPHTPPVFVYGHNSLGGYSVTGGYVYRGNTYEGLKGYYMVADYITNNLWLIKTDGTYEASLQQNGIPANIAGFGEDEQGELYAVSLSRGILYKVSVPAPLPLTFRSVGLLRQAGKNVLQWEVFGETSGVVFEVEQRLPPAGFIPVGKVTSNGNKIFTQDLSLPAGGTSFLRVKAIQPSGAVRYSPEVVAGKKMGEMNFSVAVIGAGLRLNIFEPATQVIATDLSGRLLASKTLDHFSGMLDWNIPVTGSQLVVVKVQFAAGSLSRKVWLQ